MKKILIIISSFRWGGINVALQNWLDAIDSRQYSVDIFVMVHSGAYSNQFKNCNLLSKDFLMDMIIDHVSEKKGIHKCISYLIKAMNRITRGSLQRTIYSIVGEKLVSMKNYDAVVAWHEGVPTIFTSYIKHNNKVAWIHCDYSNYTDSANELQYYSQFNSIVCVSKFAKSSFVNYYPSLETRTYAIYNILNVPKIRERAKEPVTTDYIVDKFTIISVGRVSKVKQFSRIPEVAAKVKAAGCIFRWYIVGPLYPGQEYDSIAANLITFDVSDCVFFIGSKDNPYPYISKSDLLVSTSSSESWGYTINEAKSLGIPSVSTNWGAVYESIEDGYNGFVAGIDNIHEPIIKLILDAETYKSVRGRLENFEYDNDPSLKQIESLL